jgi:two-component system LytT family response regulator
MTLRVLIVDDEPLARRGLRVRLEAMPDIEIIGECESGRTAIAAIESDAPDVVLLDVQMPGLDGFDVVDAIGADQMPVTIFVTAYDTHAIRAFDAHALDYLLKPIDDERFALAIERARTRVRERGSSDTAKERRIIFRDRGSVIILNHDDVDWISAEGDYVRVHGKGRGHLVRHTMNAMEERLDPARFARIHRSAIVNVDRVAEVRPYGERDHIVVLKDGVRLRMGRAYAAITSEVLGRRSRHV